MKVTKLPERGDVDDVVQKVKYDITFESNGHRYEAECGEWVVVSLRYEYRNGCNDWCQFAMREATSEEIEEAKGPVRSRTLVAAPPEARAGQTPTGRSHDQRYGPWVGAGSSPRS